MQNQALLAAIYAQVPTLGRIFFVMSPSDYATENYQRIQEFAASDKLGKIRFFGANSAAGATPIELAYAAVQTNNDDVIALDGHTEHLLSAALTVSKSRVHFLGLDGGHRLQGQGARIKMGVTGVATDYAPVINVGTRNSFRNIKVENASTTNGSLYGFVEAGECTLIENCHTLKTAGLDDANHAHFLLASDSATIRHLTVGQSNTPNTAAGFGILIDGYAGGVVKENLLEDIYINMSVGGSVQATSCFIKVADNAALNFGNVINRVVGNNFIPVGGTIMTDAVLGVAQISGNLLISNAVFSGSTGVGSASGQGIYTAAAGLAPVANGGLSTELTD